MRRCFLGRYKTEGILEADPETAFHFINPTTADSPRNDWDKSITQRDILQQPHPVYEITRFYSLNEHIG